MQDYLWNYFVVENNEWLRWANDRFRNTKPFLSSASSVSEIIIREFHEYFMKLLNREIVPSASSSYGTYKLCYMNELDFTEISTVFSVKFCAPSKWNEPKNKKYKFNTMPPQLRIP